LLLRRTKEQVLKDLPPRTEMVRWVDLEGGQRDLYESLRVAFDRKLRRGADRAGHRPQPDHDFRCAAETAADLLRSAPGQAAGGRSAGEKGPRPFGQAGDC
jgi:hypothetical protein